MAAGRVRRAADSSVATAVSSIIQHQKFKKMLIFGLRSLSDLCNPTLQLFVENSIDALNRNVVQSIVTAIDNFNDDEDLLLCSSQILSAMAHGCVEEKENPAVVKKLLADGGLNAVEKILSTCPAEEIILDYCYTFVEKLSSIKALPNGGISTIPHLCKSMDKVESTSIANKLYLCFSFIVQSSAGAAAVNTNGGVTGILTKTSKLAEAVTPANTILVENCFKVLKLLSDAKVVDDTHLEMIVPLVETFKISKIVLNRANDIIKSVVNTEKLQQSLTGLQAFEPGTPEHKSAVTTLRSISYITTISDELAKSGAIPLLIDLINKTIPKLETHAQISDVICGASRMLAGISTNPTFGKEVVTNGGVETLVSALSSCVAYPLAVNAISDALAQLVYCDWNVFLRTNAIAIALPILYQLSEDQLVASSLMNFVSVATQIPDLKETFAENKVIEILSTCCQYHVDNLAYHMNTIQVLNRFSSYVKDLSTVYEYGGLQGIAFSLAHNCKDDKFCLETLNLLLTFAATPGAQQYMNCGEVTVTTSILELMLDHKDNEIIIDLAVKALEILVTEADVKNYMSDVSTILSNSREDLDATYRKLAAVTGLYRIVRLRPIIAANGILPQVMKTVSSWIESAPFDGLTKLTRAALQTTILASGDGNECQLMIRSVTDLALLPQVKRIIDLEDPEDNFLLHCTGALRLLCGVERTYTDEQCLEAVECLNRLMRKYSDIRQAQIACIEAFNNLIQVTGKVGLDAMLSSGGLASIVSYLSKVPMYLQCQIIGISLLCTCAKMDPSAVECLKRCHCFQLLRTVNRTHTRNKRLRSMIGVLLSMLMPADALETELSQLMQDLTSYMDAKDFEGVHTTLASINQLLVSREAVRIAARINIGDAITKATDWVMANGKLADSVQVNEEGDLNGKPLLDSALYELAQVTNNMCQNRIGLVYSTKLKFTGLNLKIFSFLNQPVSTHTEDAASTSIEALTTLLLHDKINVDAAFDEDVFSKICRSFPIFLNSPTVIRAICKCIAALCSSPGRIDKLLGNSDFMGLTNKLVNMLREDDSGHILNSLMALSELLKTEDVHLLKYFSDKTDVVACLFTVLELHPNEPELVALASECLYYFGKDRLLAFKNLPKAFSNISDALSINKNSSSTVIPLLNLLVAMACPETKDALKQSGIVDVVSSVMMIHVGIDEIALAGGILFGLLGAACQIRALMRNVIEIVEKQEDGAAQKVDKLCINLAMYLLSPLENRREALSDTEAFLASLNKIMAFAADNQNLLFNASCVSRRLCDSAFDDSEDQFGAWAVASSNNLLQIATTVNTDFGASNIKFLCHAYRIFSACVVNVYTTDLMQEEAAKLMPKSLELLERYKNNADVCHSILEFLLYLSISPESSSLPENNGSGVILNQCKALNADVVACITDLMINHKGHDSIVILSMKLISQLATYSKDLDKKSVEATLDASQRLCIGEISEERKICYMNLVTSLLNGGYIKNSKVVEDLIVTLNSSGYEGISALDLVKFVGAALAAGFLLVLNNTGSLTKLLDLLDDKACNDKNVLLTLLKSLKGVVKENPEDAALALKDILPPVLNGTLLTSDIECATVYCDLLVDAVKTEGVGRILYGIPNLNKSLVTIDELAKKEGNAELSNNVKNILEAMRNDLPKKKTCQTVHLSLEARKAENLSLSVKDYPLLIEEVEFLLATMNEYGTRVLSADEEDGLDHTFGSLCFEILLKDSNNCAYSINHGFFDMVLKVYKQQKDLKILNSVTSALCAGLLNSDFVVAFITKKEVLSTIDRYLFNVHNVKDIVLPSSHEEEESLELALINALLLIEFTAINRKIYLNYNVIKSVIDIWNAYDAKKYKHSRLLRQTFRTLRKIIAEGHLDLMLRCNMVSRIKNILATSTDLSLIPDALFLVGSMAVVPTIKSQICELKLLDGILELLHKQLSHPEGSNAVVTNICLALANTCVDNKTSSDRFVQLKGPNLNVQVLTKYKESYEVVNGGSILLCNLLYKNDPLKELYGKNGAPAALVDCLRAFAGSSHDLAMRCIESLFKAISNLGLYAKNVSFFLDANIQDSFEVWLAKLDPKFEDAKLKIGLQTLSNLVMENKPGNMAKFSVVLVPVLHILAQERSDCKVIFLLIDILTSLCRLESNCKIYLDNNGLDLTMKAMRRMSYDVEILITGIHLLGIQTHVKDGVVRLLEMDIYSLLLNILTFDGQGAELNEVLVATLRCMRRLVVTDEMVYLLCSQDGLTTLIDLTMKTKTQSSVVIECCRLILGMLDLTNPKVESDPPAWENVGMEKTDVENLLKVICVSATGEAVQKMIRLQKITLSVVAYFLSCGLGGETLSVNGFTNILDVFLLNFGSTQSAFLLCTVILENTFTLPVDVRNNLVTRELVKRYKDTIAYMPNKKPEEKAFRERCNKLVDALSNNADVILESTGKFNFELSEWSVDPYPHGIHDLPEASKDALRTGGKLKALLNNDTTLSNIRWRSTQDLNCLEWGPEKEDYPFKIPILRIRNISRGIKHPILEAANVKEPRKFSSQTCFCMFGSATEDFPDGFILPIKCKSGKERDNIVELLIQWRDAASYN